MLIPTGTVHKAKVTGVVVKQVDCDNCTRQFFYLLRRTGGGRDSAPLFIGEERAKQAAGEKALANLQYYLETGADPVSCPSCGFYQQDMVVAARDLRMSVPKIIGFSALAFFGPLIISLPLEGTRWEPILGLVGFLLGLGVFATLLRRRISHDPNEDAASRVGRTTEGPPTRYFSREEAERALGELEPSP